MLEAEWDAWFLGKATAYGRKLMQTKAFSEILVEEEVFPGCASLISYLCSVALMLIFSPSSFCSDS